VGSIFSSNIDRNNQ